MPVRLRLKRQGRKKHPHYAIVASDGRSPRDGRFIEKVGFYDPVMTPARVYVNHEAALKWLLNGAQPSTTVRNLLRHAGVTVKFALIKQGKSEEEIERIFNRWRSDKDRKAKKKIISVDLHGDPIEPVPGEDKKPAPSKSVLTEAPEEEVVAPTAEAPAPVVEEEAPAVEEAPVVAEESPEGEE